MASASSSNNQRFKRPGAKPLFPFKKQLQQTRLEFSNVERKSVMNSPRPLKNAKKEETIKVCPVQPVAVLPPPPLPTLPTLPGQSKGPTVHTTDIKALLRLNHKHFICELIGQVESAVVTANKASNAKIFQLKDSTAAIQCIFYEIDRTMPKVIRGQWYKCVGVVQRSGSLQCLSIRPATKEEQKHVRSLIHVDESVQALQAAKTAEP